MHIPYPCSPAAMTALMRGDVQMACLPAISVTPHVATGKAKILAVSLPTRSPFLPDIPTLKESGIDVEADTWMGLIAPGGTPPALIDAIHKDVVEAINTKADPREARAPVMEPVGNSPAAFPHGYRRRDRALGADHQGGGREGQLKRRGRARSNLRHGRAQPNPSSCPALCRASTSCFFNRCQERRGWPGRARP